MGVHTGLCVCQVCGKTFGRGAGLWIHVRTHSKKNYCSDDLPVLKTYRLTAVFLIFEILTHLVPVVNFLVPSLVCPQTLRMAMFSSSSFCHFVVLGEAISSA